MTPIYGSRTPRFKVMLALFGESKGWNCKECPICGEGPFDKCKNWIIHLGVSHPNDPLLQAADQIWADVMMKKFDTEEELVEFVQKLGRERELI